MPTPAPPSQTPPPAVPNNQALVLRAEMHPEATLTQAIQAAMSAARLSRCSVAFHVEQGKKRIEVVVTPDDTYQGVQKRVNQE